jgi:hypothetical protein
LIRDYFRVTDASKPAIEEILAKHGLAEIGIAGTAPGKI